MIELESTKIRKKILLLCGFYEHVIKNHELIYREGSKNQHLQEIKAIRTDIVSNKTFRLAFVGEYSSGKTSIINILTGTKMPVSTTVETDKSFEIPWNNVTIIDTPGLGSGRKDHDDITKEWLAKADLLVYLLTPDLLTKAGGKRLLNMLDKYNRDHEMMIVMNMIDQEGNDISEYRNELQSLLEPRPLEMFFPVYISAQNKETSTNTALDAEDRHYFEEKSRFSTFVDTLNLFILNKREKSALTTPLTRLQTLSRKIAFKNKFDKEGALLDCKIDIYESASRDVQVAFDDFKEHIDDSAKGATGNIFIALDSFSDLQNRVEDEVNRFSVAMQESVECLADEIANITDELKVQGDKLDTSKLGEEVFNSIKESCALQEIFKVDMGIGKNRGQAKEYLDQVKLAFDGMNSSVGDFGARKDVDNPLDSKNVFNVTGQLAAKIDKAVILKIGHKVGYKFKPWQATKLSSKFTKAVPYVNIAAVALEVVMLIREKQQENEADRQRREFKQDMSHMFQHSVDDTNKMLNDNLIEPVNAVISTGMSLLKEKKLEILGVSEKNRDLALQIEGKRDECMQIYNDIYETRPI